MPLLQQQQGHQPLWIIMWVVLCGVIVYMNWQQQQRKRRMEYFDNRLIKAIKIKIGVWVHRDNMGMSKFVHLLTRVVPIDIVPYANKFQPFYALQQREVDLIFTDEKDYMIYWLNQKKKDTKMQLIAFGYYLYICMIANYHTIVRAEDMHNSVIALGPKEDMEHDYERSMVKNYSAHLTYRNKDDLEKDMEEVGKGTIDVTFVLSSHPNQLMLSHSNRQEIYIMSLADAKITNDDIYNQYLFLNKKKLDLTYYPKMYQRYNARNRMDSLVVNTSPLLDVFGIKTLFLGLESLNNTYVYEFTKAYTTHIFDAMKDKLYFNNFNKLDVSSSRLTDRNGTLPVHNGARKYFQQIGNYSLNPNKNCALLQNACRPSQLSAYGDYAQLLTDQAL